MQPIEIAVAAAVFFLGQVAFELQRWLGSRLAGRALRGMSRLRPAWDILALLAALGGVAAGIYGLVHWTWWKVPLLWLGSALPGSLLGKSLRRIDEAALLKIERACHAAIVAGAAWLWAQRYLLG